MVSLAALTGLAVILAVPGPTNALLLAAGAAQARAPALLVACTAAYLAAVAAYGLLLGPALAAAPGWAVAIKVVAAVYLAIAALRLWRAGDGTLAAPLVSPGLVAGTTLLNPKGLMIAVAIFPEGWAAGVGSLAAHLAVLGILVPVTGGSWIGLGALLRRHGRAGLPRLVPKAAALVLALFALTLARSALAG
jgi:threonine/homoserine/homoserine lactone efflux protein